MEIPYRLHEIIKKHNDRGFVLCGSLALQLQGVRLERESINDVDFCTNLIKNADFDSASHAEDSYSHYIDSGYKIDILTCPFEIKAIRADGLLVQEKEQIIDIKRQYAEKGSQKHVADLYYLNRMAFYESNISLI